MLVDVLCRGFRMHGYVSCGHIEDRGYWFHNSVRRLDTDVISYSRLECTLGFGHIYFRICFIFIRVFSCVKCSAIRPVDCDTLCQTLKWKITKAGNEISRCILFNRPLPPSIKKSPLLYRWNRFHDAACSRDLDISPLLHAFIRSLRPPDRPFEQIFTKYDNANA